MEGRSKSSASHASGVRGRAKETNARDLDEGKIVDVSHVQEQASRRAGRCQRRGPRAQAQTTLSREQGAQSVGKQGGGGGGAVTRNWIEKGKQSGGNA